MLKQIYLIHHTHYDIGFTDLPDEVERQQLTYLDQAVALAEADPEYHWTIESGSLLRNYLDYRPAPQKEKMIQLLQKGQLEVAAFDMQMLTETASFPELLENVSRPAELGKKYNFPVECAILDDIGGFAGEVPLLMNQAGIRYLIAGCGAFQTELPWADLPHLFYLKSAYGGKILVWNLGINRNETSCKSRYPSPVYGIGSIFLGYRSYPEILGEYDLGIKMPMADDTESHKLSAKEVFQILTNRLEEENYPYSEVLLQYGGDNRNPAPRLAELVRKLNAAGDYPEIKLCTPSAYFRMMEEKYGPQIPEISGILADPWNIRINAVPTVLKKYRHAQDLYRKSQLHGLKDNNITENMMLVADHTLGLNNWGWQKKYDANGKYLSAACFDRVRESWQCKADYASAAYRDAVKLLRTRAVNAAFDNKQAVIVRNHSPHLVSGTVELYLGSYAAKLIHLTDDQGNEIPRQLIEQNKWMLSIKDVPALGSLRLNPVFSDEFDDIPAPVESEIPAEIKTDFFRIELASDGSLKSVCTGNGTPLICGSGCELLCEEHFDSGVAGEECGLRPSIERKLIPLENKSAKVLADGDLFTEFLLSGTFADDKAERRLRIWKKLKRIDVFVRLDLQELYEKRCYYVQFPFAGEKGTFRFDQNVGIAKLDQLLPGSMQDLFFCSRYASVETDSFTATLCCPDAPIVEFDGMHTAEWRKTLPLTTKNNHIYGLVYNNICNTDAPSWQRVLDTFQYSLFFHDGTFDTAAAHEAWDSVSALESELSFELPDPGITPVPSKFRVHCDAAGSCWIEDPGKGTLTKTEIRGKRETMDPAIQALEKSLSWFLNSGVMPQEGKTGVAERIVLTKENPALGKIREMFPNLTEHDGYWIIENRRADCCFETALLFLLAGKKLNNSFYHSVGENILEYLFEKSGMLQGDIWNWYVPLASRAWWYDDNGWVAAIELFLGQHFPELDRKYDLTAKGKKAALMMGGSMIRNLTSEQPVKHGVWPDKIFFGEPRQPHWGTPVCVALMLAGEFEMVRKYHQWGEQNWQNFALSEWAYALISSAIGGKLGDNYLREQSLKIRDYLKNHEKEGILPSEHCEAPSGESLADLIYTLNWYLPGLALVENGQKDFLKLRDFIISIQNPDGSWQGMFDITRGIWAGGDLYEGGANSLYTGWTNTVLALCMMF